MNNKNLLPPGFRDDLSPTTETEHIFTNKIISVFNSNGYQIVKPPLIEFLNNKEDKNIFVIINDSGEKKLKIRNDITMQVARIASSRFKDKSRPLRLCYYGEVVRDKGSILRPERQFLQVGAECIGEKKYLADAEILILAFKSLQAVGIKDISVDFSNPIFLNNIIDKDLKNGSKKEFLKYLQRKDISKTLSLLKNSKKINFIKDLIECTGNLSKNIKLLNKLKINKNFSNEIINLLKIYEIAKNKFDKIVYNIDLTENRSHSYYTGLNFTLFAKNVRGEIASGGKYLTKSYGGENGTGFTCYMDTIVRASSLVLKKKIIMVPFKTPDKILKNLINKDFIVERYFDSIGKIKNIAMKRNCTHILLNEKINKIKND